MIAQNERMEQDFIAYFNSIIYYKAHSNTSNSIIVNWTRVGKLLNIYFEGKPILFKDLSVKLLEGLKLFMFLLLWVETYQLLCHRTLLLYISQL